MISKSSLPFPYLICRSFEGPLVNDGTASAPSYISLRCHQFVITPQLIIVLNESSTVSANFLTSIWARQFRET